MSGPLNLLAWIATVAVALALVLLALAALCGCCEPPRDLDHMSVQDAAEMYMELMPEGPEKDKLYERWARMGYIRPEQR